jgi:hypothetical protein
MDSDPDELAQEQWLLDLMQHTSEALGRRAVARRLQDPRVLLALLKQEGTAVRPRTDGRYVSLHLQPLLDLTGPRFAATLKRLADDLGEGEQDLRVALAKEVESPSVP